MAKYNDVYNRAETFATLAYNLGELIIKSGMKQAEVARAIGTRPQYMNAVVMGRRPFPIEWVLPVCKVLKCSPNILFGHEQRFVPIDSNGVSNSTNTSEWTPIRDFMVKPQMTGDRLTLTESEGEDDNN